MTKIKLCGLSRPCDIQTANVLMPDYIGFVFAPKSRRYVSPEQAARLRSLLLPGILAVGVFVNEDPHRIAGLLKNGTIDIAQLHGTEDETYIQNLRALTDKPIIQAFRIERKSDVAAASKSSADYVLADSGSGGTGTTFDWGLLQTLDRPFFLAGGLNPENVTAVLTQLHPYAVDVSSGIETDKSACRPDEPCCRIPGSKDPDKMRAFVQAVKNRNNNQ